LEQSSETDQLEYYLTSLDELGEVLIDADKIESVASGILRLTLGTVMASKGAIFIFQGIENSFQTLSSIGVKNKKHTLPITDGFLNEIKNYQYGHLNFKSSPSWIKGDLKKYINENKLKTIIPLFHKNRLLGVLYIGEKFMSESYTNVDFKILEIVANHLTKALYNYELIDNVEQKKKELNLKLLELETLFDISVAISSVLDIDELSSDVLIRAIGILNASKGMFLLENENSPILNILSSFNWGEKKFLLSKNTDIFKEIQNSKKGFILTSHDQKDIQKKLEEKNLIIVPLRAKNRILGYMILCDKETRQGVESFTNIDLDLLTSLSNQAAVAMDNAKLFKEITEAKQFNESILGSIATGVITVNSMGEVDSINVAAKNILRMDEDLATGNHYMYLFEKDEEIIELIVKTEADKKVHSEINIKFLTVSEDTIINISVAPRIDLNGEAKGVVIAVEDISDINKVKNTFKRYVSKQVVDNLLDDETKLNLGGEDREVTILFTDIRGFTSMSEKMKPEQVVLTLNEYFSEMIDIVFKYNGTLDKIIGDELMIVYGAPLSASDDTERAITTAIEMQEKIRDLNKIRKKRKEPLILVGAGINKGQVVSGNIGSREMMDYTVIGDTVNLGARLCSAASAGQILVSGSVWGTVKNKFKFEELSAINVKGKKDKIPIYEVNY